MEQTGSRDEGCSVRRGPEQQKRDETHVKVQSEDDSVKGGDHWVMMVMTTEW